MLRMKCWLWDGTLLTWISTSHIPEEHRPSSWVSVSRFLWLYCCCSQRNNHPCLHVISTEQWHQLRDAATWEEPTTKAFMQSCLCAWCPVPDRTLCLTTSLCWTDSVPWSSVPYRRMATIPEHHHLFRYLHSWRTKWFNVVANKTTTVWHVVSTPSWSHHGVYLCIFHRQAWTPAFVQLGVHGHFSTVQPCVLPPNSWKIFL